MDSDEKINLANYCYVYEVYTRNIILMKLVGIPSGSKNIFRVL